MTGTGRVRRQQAALRRPCPVCGAAKGRPCTRTERNVVFRVDLDIPLKRPHTRRVTAMGIDQAP